MRVLVTGGAGLVGTALARLAPHGVDAEITVHTSPATVAGVKSHRVDLTQSMAFLELIERRRPDLVIHTAYSKTDHRATIDSATEVAVACGAAEIALIHFSTDAVFDGDHPPYDEAAQPSPVHGYGRAKSIAETAVREACPDAAIVRTSLVLAADGSDSTSAWAIESMRRGEVVTFFDDEFRCPIFVDDLAHQTWEIAALGAAERAGVWHLVGPERLSRADVGRCLIERFDLDAALMHTASAETMGEPRPRDLSLSSQRIGSLHVQARPIGSVGDHGTTSEQPTRPA